MKVKFLILTAAAALLCCATVSAQSGGGVVFEKDYHLFDFSLNASRFEAGINLGQVGSFTDRARFGHGAFLMYNGFYLDFITAAPQHKHYTQVSNENWHDNSAMSIQAGYQVPILPWLRIMPLLGYCQTNEGITDASTARISTGDGAPTWYHDYEVIPDSRRHYFNYGCGISIQPSEWFSINIVGTRYALYGGIGVDILTLSERYRK